MSKIRPQTARFMAIAIIMLLYGLSQLPQLSASERAELAAGFKFKSSVLPEAAGFTYKSIRQVHPDLEHIAAWISAFGGSAIALNDLDGDGLANDACHIDARVDQVIISALAETSGDRPARYKPFVLDHSHIAYDSSVMAPTGCIPNDMNEDGYMDLLIYYWGRTPIAFINQGSSPLSAKSYNPVEILPGEDIWWSSAGTFADFDGDGHADLIISNYFPDNKVLLAGQKGQVSHLNHSLSRAFNGGDTHIFLWEAASSKAEPQVKFRKVEGVFAEQVSRGWTLAVGAADLDGDLLPEIYLSNDYGPDRLLHNRSQAGELRFVLLEGEKFFNTPNSKIVGRDSFKGMGVDFGDVNEDGLFDIYVSNIAADYAFHESHFMFLSTGQTERMQDGIAPYIDYSEPLGLARSSWSWETRLADFNNDGKLEALQATGFLKGEVNRWPELQELGLGNDELSQYPGSWNRIETGHNLNGHEPNRFFVRSSSTRFFDLAPDVGLDEYQVTRGIATADIDGDGDLDFALANQWESSYFYRNECPDCANFLGLHLLLAVDGSPPATTIIRPGHPGPDTVGRPAVGAWAKVQLPNGQERVGMVDGGNGQSGVRSSNIHFGLSNIDSDTFLAVELQWRDSKGGVNQKTVQLNPGWHTILLN